MTMPLVTGQAPRQIALLLAKHGEELARHIRRILHDDDTAQDVLQETMLRAHRALPALGAGANQRAWLYRVATNVALNLVRSRIRERAALERHAAERELVLEPHADGQDEPRRAALWAEVARLPERQRLALTLRIADELDYEEIARRLGGTAAAARANVYQATRRLKREVRDP
jgi:RNA polymerase sigma-70 factor (ECF subfamily)